MRKILIPILVSSILAACADQPPPDETIAATFAELRGEPTPDIICDPWCDPSQPDDEVNATLAGAYDFAWAAYPDATWQGQGCVDFEPGTECVVRFSTPDFACGPVSVDCTNFPTHGRNRVRCRWLPVGCY